MLGFLLLLLIGFVLALGAATLLVVLRLRNPPRRTYAAALARGIPPDPSEAKPPRAFHAFIFDAPTADGKTTLARHAWVIEGEQADGPLIICSPGWGDSKVGVIPRLPALAAVASSIIVWDLAGLGESPGKCRLGAHSDVMELCALVESQERRDVILYGWSLGAGLSIAAGAELARRGVSIAAVIAEAPYCMPQTPARNVMRFAGLPYRMNVPIAFALLGLRLGEGMRWSRFDRAELARRLTCPLMVLHGDADDTCPLEDSRAIAQTAARATLSVLPGAGHNNVWTEAPHFGNATGAVREFVDSLS